MVQGTDQWTRTSSLLNCRMLTQLQSTSAACCCCFHAVATDLPPAGLAEVVQLHLLLLLLALLLLLLLLPLQAPQLLPKQPSA